MSDLETYTGTIEMLDYMQQKPIVLNCMIHLRQYISKNKKLNDFKQTNDMMAGQIVLGKVSMPLISDPETFTVIRYH